MGTVEALGVGAPLTALGGDLEQVLPLMGLGSSSNRCPLACLHPGTPPIVNILSFGKWWGWEMLFKNLMSFLCKVKC